MSEGEGGAQGGEGRVADPAGRLEALLKHEREAAVAADVERLATLQGDKRAAMTALRASVVAEDRLAALQREMQLNVMLIRQLVQSLGGIVGVERQDTYNAYGRRESLPPTLVRGAL